MARKKAAKKATRTRRNPPLIVWANPGKTVTAQVNRKLAHRVFEVRYKHNDDRNDYKHPFGPNVVMYTVEIDGVHAILLFDKNGKDIWAEF